MKTMKTMTQRKQYARPQMTVVELRHQCCILAGSNRSSANMNATFSEEDWDNE